MKIEASRIRTWGAENTCIYCSLHRVGSCHWNPFNWIFGRGKWLNSHLLYWVSWLHLPPPCSCNFNHKNQPQQMHTLKVSSVAFEGGDCSAQISIHVRNHILGQSLNLTYLVGLLWIDNTWFPELFGRRRGEKWHNQNLNYSWQSMGPPLPTLHKWIALPRKFSTDGLY